jgi:hypothetical protein
MDSLLALVLPQELLVLRLLLLSPLLSLRAIPPIELGLCRWKALSYILTKNAEPSLVRLTGDTIEAQPCRFQCHHDPQSHASKPKLETLPSPGTQYRETWHSYSESSCYCL